MQAWIISLVWLLCGISRNGAQQQCAIRIDPYSKGSGVIAYDSSRNGGECTRQLQAPEVAHAVIIRVIDMIEGSPDNSTCPTRLYFSPEPGRQSDEIVCQAPRNFCWIYILSPAQCDTEALKQSSVSRGCNQQEVKTIRSFPLSIRAEKLTTAEVYLLLNYSHVVCENHPASQKIIPPLPSWVFRPSTTSTSQRPSTSTTTSSIGYGAITEDLGKVTSQEKAVLATGSSEKAAQNDTSVTSTTLQHSVTVDLERKSRGTGSRDTGSDVTYIVIIALLAVLLIASLIAIVLLGVKIRRMKAASINSTSNGILPVADGETNGKIEATAMAELVESVAYGTTRHEEGCAYATVE